jgi:serine/threonine protein kinase
VTEHVDFWALGVMLFEMVSGRRPYSHYEHDRSRLETAIRMQEPRLRVPHDLDPRLTAVIEKLLATQIENRYHSARQIAADLQAFLDRTPVVAFVEACRANQATVRVPTAADAHRSDSTRPTEPVLSGNSAAGSTSPDVGGITVATEPVPSEPRVPTVPSVPQRLYKAWVAAALSLLAPGLGQIYNREYLRGIFWLIVTPGFWIGSAGALGWPFHLIAAYTAYLRARPPAASSTTSSSGPTPSSWLARLRTS